MRKGLIGTVFATLLVTLAAAASATGPGQTPLTPAARESLVHQHQPITFGVYYYPMQWPNAEWQRDFKRMGKLGFNFTHMAEFAWTYLEPEPGTFDFTWLDHAIALAHAAGLNVILGTPSAAPPVWMNQYPEVYRVDARGQRHQFGIRAEVALASPTYEKFVRRIVTAMAKHYGHDPRIWGWQLDNEPNTFSDYSAAARTTFQQWLRKKYGNIDAMNTAWGNSFWSSRYQRFDQVLIPNASLAAEDRLSPQALLDFARYQADTTAHFLDMQARIIKRYAAPRQWITTNYTNVTRASDPRRTHELDFLTYTLYPVAGGNSLGGESYAIGNPYELMEASAYFRPIDGAFGIMELQPGQVNWASITPQPMPGAINLWIWHAFATGASFVAAYRYRHALAGSEMYHEAFMGTDGVTETRTGREWIGAMHQIQAFEKHLDPRATRPAVLDARATGYLWKHDNYWDLEIQPQTRLWHTWRYRRTFTSAVKSTGAPMDFISEASDFSRYPFIIAPAYQLVDKALVGKWRAYVEAGGHLILTARTGEKNDAAHFVEGPWAAQILDLIGADIDGFDTIPPSAKGLVTSGGKTYTWHRWADLLKPRPGTDVLATYANHYYKGLAAATTRRLGKGTVTYIGVSTDDGALERTLVRDVYARAGVAIRDLPKGVYLAWRGGYTFMVNYNPKAFTPHLPAGAHVVHGKIPLAPAHVLVWQDGAR